MPLVSVAISVKCFGDSSACSTSGILGVCMYSCFFSCFDDHNACSTSGVLGVCRCFCEVLQLVTLVPFKCIIRLLYFKHYKETSKLMSEGLRSTLWRLKFQIFLEEHTPRPPISRWLIVLVPEA